MNYSSTQLTIKGHVPNHLKEICLLGYEYGVRIVVYPRDEFKKNNPSFMKSLRSVHDDNAISGLYSHMNKPLQLLVPFYEHGFVPEFVVDRILAELKLEDFRLNGERVLKIVDEKLQDGANLKECLQSIEEVLASIGSEKRRQDIRWELMTLFPQLEMQEGVELIDFCSRITDTTLPFYAESRVRLADLHLAYSEENALEKAIMALLSISRHTDVSAGLINQCVKTFVYGGVSADPLPEELQNLSAGNPDGAENILKLLRYIKKMEERQRSSGSI
ncbi:MAG: hypothetical protein KBB83_00910 [Alphaproteobacteria bacterium]|nr:hypothetical protein [Alphaproteobacteria bacterium]